MAEEKVYVIEYAGRPVRYAFRAERTAALFGSRLRQAFGEQPDVYETPEFFENAKRQMPEEAEEYAEFRSLICLTSKLLLKQGCCFFHAASFLMDGKAWLLTAPSGTGKTTQYVNWQRLHPGEIRMISGDMPLLELRGESVFAHPSPWNGKEGFGDATLTAPVGGIVILEQGGEERFETPSTAECVRKLIGQCITLLETEDEVKALALILDRILRNLPVMKFINTGRDGSTELLRMELKRIVNERNGGSNE